MTATFTYPSLTLVFVWLKMRDVVTSWSPVVPVDSVFQMLTRASDEC